MEQDGEGIGAPDSPAPEVRAVVTVTGRVQKVGFRSFVCAISEEIGLVGTVENWPDGKVRIVWEGLRSEIDTGLTNLSTTNRGTRVDDVVVEWEPATGEFERFGSEVADPAADLHQTIQTATRLLAEIAQDVKATNQGVALTNRGIESISRDLREGFAETNRNISEGFAATNRNIDALRTDIDGHFTRLDEKYGIFGELLGQLIRSTQAVQEENQQLFRMLAEILREVRGSSMGVPPPAPAG